MGLDPLAEVPVRLLSSGQLKRATLARVAASGAALWLLDEPLNALDADGAARLVEAHRRSPAWRRSGPCRVAPAAARRVADARAWPMIARLIARDLRRGFTGGAWLPIAFFLLVAALMPFAIGPDARVLARIGPGALWIAALTAALLPVERLIEPDRADGVLDQLFLHGAADESVAAATLVAHWLSFGPLLLVAAIPASALLAMDGSFARAHRDRAGDRHARTRRARRRHCGGHRRIAARGVSRRPAFAAACGALADLRSGQRISARRCLLVAVDRGRTIRCRRGHPRG